MKTNIAARYLISFFVFLSVPLIGCSESPRNQYQKAKPQNTFAINDPSVVFIDPNLPAFFRDDDAPLRLIQAEKMFIDNAPIVQTLNKEGSPGMFVMIPTKDQKSSGNMVDINFSHGAKHILIGKISFGGKYIFESNKDTPLVFKCDKEKGYVYIGGKGTVILPDKRTISLSSEGGGGDRQ